MSIINYYIIYTLSPNGDTGQDTCIQLLRTAQVSETAAGDVREVAARIRVHGASYAHEEQ